VGHEVCAGSTTPDILPRDGISFLGLVHYGSKRDSCEPQFAARRAAPGGSGTSALREVGFTTGPGRTVTADAWPRCCTVMDAPLTTAAKGRRGSEG